jgi:RNA polymerase sigma factor (TIGR02999 family)
VAPLPQSDDAGATVRPAAQPGTHETLDQVMPAEYAALRAIARRQLAVRAAGVTLSTTGLVHEAYLKLARQDHATWRDREHFMALAALAMRHVLLDRAKARLATKREGSGRPVTLDEQVIPEEEQPEALLQLNDALERLGQEEPRLARVVECRFFGGFSEPEIAEAMGVTVRTVQRDWAKARMFLRRALES